MAPNPKVMSFIRTIMTIGYNRTIVFKRQVYIHSTVYLAMVAFTVQVISSILTIKRNWLRAPYE
jgi:hypothetical protein